MISEGTVIVHQEKPHPTRYSQPTISNGHCWNNLEFLPNPRVEQTGEIKPIRPFFPPSEVGNLVPMYYIALRAYLAEVAYFGIYCGEQETTVRRRTIAYVARAIVPGETDTSKWLFAFTPFVAGRRTLRWEKLHYTSHRIRGAVTNGPTG